MGDKFGWEKDKRKEAARRGQKAQSEKQKKARKKSYRPRGAMPFGKHKGQAIDTIPVDYLEWVLANVSPLTEWLRRTMARVVIAARLKDNPPKMAPPAPCDQTNSVTITGKDYVKYSGPADSLPWWASSAAGQKEHHQPSMVPVQPQEYREDDIPY